MEKSSFVNREFVAFLATTAALLGASPRANGWTSTQFTSSWFGRDSNWTTGTNWSAGTSPPLVPLPSHPWYTLINPIDNSTTKVEPAVSVSNGQSSWYLVTLVLQTGSSVTQNSGTITIQQNFQVGWRQSASYNLTGGTLALSGGGLNTEINVSSDSVFTQTGGAVTVDSNGFLSVAADSVGMGTFYYNTGGGTYYLEGGTVNCPSLRVGNSSVNSSNALFSFSGGTLTTGSITLTNGGRFQYDSLAGTATSTTPFIVNGGVIDVPSLNAALTLKSNVSVTGAIGLTKIGNGVLSLTSNLTSSSTISVTQGTLVLSGKSNVLASVVGNSGALTVGAGTSLTSGSVDLGTLTINGVHTLSAPSGAASVVRVFILAGSANNWTGDLNITTNKLIIEDAISHATTLATTQNQVAYAKTHTGGIASSTLPANDGIAVIDNSIANFSTFGGTAVDPNSILIAPELLGDTNADGHVDLSDLSVVLNNFGASTAAWTSGNFDNAATIDLTDLSDVLNNFGLINPNASGLTGGIGATETPEPTSLAFLSFGAGVMSTRRRRNR